MARLIDADALLADFKARAIKARNWKENAILNGNEEATIRADATIAFLTEVKLTIENAPTIDSLDLDVHIGGRCCGKRQRLLDELRPKGKWIERGNYVYCSNCNAQEDDAFPNYCWHCGADMRGNV